MLTQLTSGQTKVVNKILDQRRDYSHDDVLEFSRGVFGAPDQVYNKAHELLFKYLHGNPVVQGAN